MNRITKTQMKQVYLDFIGKGQSVTHFMVWANGYYPFVTQELSLAFWESVIARGKRISLSVMSRDTSRELFNPSVRFNFSSMNAESYRSFINRQNRALLSEYSA